MKNNEKESSIISELCNNNENETKALKNTNEDIEQLGIVVTTKEFNDILKQSRKTCPEPDKICYKQEKDRSKAENYRTILTNCRAKICETVVKTSLWNIVKVKTYSARLKSAYWKQCCTTYNLLKLTQHVSEAFQWSEMFDCVRLDIGKRSMLYDC